MNYLPHIGAVLVGETFSDIVFYGNAVKYLSGNCLLHTKPLIIYATVVFALFFGYEVYARVVTHSATLTAVFTQ